MQDLSTDPRWRAFAAQAASELGVRSMLAHVLPVDGRALGAVNVYAMEPHAFRPEHEASSPSFGATAVGAMGVVRHQEQVEHPETALHTSRHIGVALGILMNARRISLDEAWDELRQASQDKNITVSTLAERVIATDGFDRG
ncbi:ANTAR domain-containing protein [Phycicoccus sp. 3266]|uniref:ANTAR domain-containing protein n=1 Tax=Phycicoccus sp. 3266 TaxID=2817751 RepID=UPI0028623490|nr:ANTAR domain-containing protein [Phycicoccus sp. 3266]MDR6862686.1 hypothetical protein [Phycicoccus sp. 3266]